MDAMRIANHIYHLNKCMCKKCDAEDRDVAFKLRRFYQEDSCYVVKFVKKCHVKDRPTWICPICRGE